MLIGGSPLLQPTNADQNGTEIEMDNLSQKSAATSSSSKSESEDFKKLSDYTKHEKLSLLLPIISVLISITVMVLMIISHGHFALLVCRAFALYSITFLLITFGRMLWNVAKIQRSGHFRRKFFVIVGQN
uniref:Uncharacterized protein n=1 Tax=Panagrolaimus sp. ES5 TaxID=591445 RepID=A0AC34FNZ8_9BILA